MTDDQNFTAGILTFSVEHRIFGDDGGPALRVFADVDGAPRQLLRFDCFRNSPHYHYDPTGKDEIHPLNKDEVPDSIAWTIHAIGSDVAEMIRHAGYPAVADGVSSEAVNAVLADVTAAMRAE